MNPLPRILDRGDGPAVLFVHAFPLNAGMWMPQIDALRDLRRIAFDLPGVAGGGAARPDLTMDAAADLCVRVLDACGVDRAAIAGCSMGGYITMAALRLHPDRFTAAVLADTRAGADTPEARTARTAQAADVLAHGTAALIDGMLPKLLSAAGMERDPALAPRVRALMEEATPAGVASMLHAMRDRADASDTIRALGIPVCAIVGTDDALTPPHEAELIASLAPQGVLHIIPDAGHLPNIEQSDRFNAIVQHFLAPGTTASGARE